MLDSPRTMIMCKDLQLKLNIDTGEGGGEREGRAKLSNLPKSFGEDCRCTGLQCIIISNVMKSYTVM